MAFGRLSDDDYLQVGRQGVLVAGRGAARLPLTNQVSPVSLRATLGTAEKTGPSAAGVSWLVARKGSSARR